MKDKLKIELIDWDYTCGDGCCYMYGTRLKLNGEELEHPDYPEQHDNSYVGCDVENALTAVLTKLGYEVDFTREYDTEDN